MISGFTRRVRGFLCAGVLFFGPDSAAAQTVDIAAQIANWRLATDLADPKSVCFAAAQPSDTLPKGANRAPVYFYVSTWPKDGVKTEVSVKLGYPIKKGTEPTLTIDAEKFAMFSEGDRAYIGDSTSELKAIEAMRKGTTMTVRAISERGTATTDTYSLAGVVQALQKLSAVCP